MTAPDAGLEAVLRHAAIPGRAGLFVLGVHEPESSIYLQQVRALCLAWALESSGRLPAGARVAVIGGGAAGLTVAAALAIRGAAVTLLEREPALVPALSSAAGRWLHPHVREWPDPGALDPAAGVPVLDWTAAAAPDVAAQLSASFVRIAARHDLAAAASIQLRDMRQSATGWHLEWSAPETTRCVFDAVVLALGPGPERTFPPLPGVGYRAAPPPPATRAPAGALLVSGAGECGTLEVLFHRLREPRVDALMAACAAVPGMDRISQQLLEIETAALETPDPAAHLSAAYAALDVPAAVDAQLSAMLHPQAQVWWGGPSLHPLSPGVSLPARFLASRLLATGAVRPFPGRLVAADPVQGGWRVATDAGPPRIFATVVVRHGTTNPLRAGFPAFWESYKPVRIGRPSPPAGRLWPPGFFGPEAPADR